MGGVGALPRARCARRGRTDWPLLRRRAVELAAGRARAALRRGHRRRGAGPHGDVQVRLLMALDTGARAPQPDVRRRRPAGDLPRRLQPALGRARRARPLVPAAHELAQHAVDRRGRRGGHGRRAVRRPRGRARARARPARRRCRAGAASCPSCTSSTPTRTGDEVLRQLLGRRSGSSPRPTSPSSAGRSKAWTARRARVEAARRPDRRHSPQLAKTRGRRARRGPRRHASKAARASSSSSSSSSATARATGPCKPFWLKDRGDRDEWWRRERRKLFVAMTRARDRLALVAWPPLADSARAGARALRRVGLDELSASLSDLAASCRH